MQKEQGLLNKIKKVDMEKDAMLNIAITLRFIYCFTVLYNPL